MKDLEKSAFLKKRNRTRQIRIPSDIAYIKKVISKIEHFLKPYHVDKDTFFDIRLCMEEALRNAILHGNKGDKNLPVLISYSFKDGKFIVEIEDKGTGFKPTKLPDPTEDENLLREGGRGVFIMHKLMDEIKYSDMGNKVSMVKYIK